MQQLFRMGISLLSFFLIASAQANPQNAENFGPYTAYYSVFNSTFISPEIAQIYNLNRGKDLAFVNIAVVKRGQNGSADSNGLAVDLEGAAIDLMQRRQALKFIKIEEPGATYYLAPFKFTHEEIWHFSIDIASPDPAQSHRLEFNKKLYRND